MPLTKTKLVRYIKELGLSYKETSKSFIFNCPCCGGKQKLYIRKEDGRFVCFRCKEENGMSGKVEYALVELTDLSLNEIKSALYGGDLVKSTGFLDLQLIDFWAEDEEDIIEEVEEPLKPVQWPYWAISIVANGAKAGANYLLKRGIPAELANFYGIRYSTERRAIMFPVHSGDLLYGWQYRTIDQTRYLTDAGIVETTKAWSSKDLPKNKVFMFANRLINSNHAVITEGPLDALKCHGFGGNVAAMGKEVGAAQVKTILRHGIKYVYSGLDPDAFAELDPLLKKLGEEVRVYKVDIPIREGVKDLGDLSLEESVRVINNSSPVLPGRLYVWMKPLEV
jgi:hypothetical protein